MPVPAIPPGIDDGRWSNLPPNPWFDTLRVRVLTAHFYRLNQRWCDQHRHDPFDRIYHVTEGSAVIEAQGRELIVRPGMSYLIPALTSHQHRCARSVTMYWTHVITVVDGERGLFEDAPGVHAQAVDIPATVDCFRRLCAACEDTTPAAALIRSACALELLAPFTGLRQTPIDLERERFIPVLSAIEGLCPSPEEALTVAHMAGLMGMSPDHFTRRFTSLFAMTPARYRQRRRLAAAQRLLAESDITIDAVARRCGFCDGFHLSKVFRHLLGTTPSAYRLRSRRPGP